MTSTKRVSLLLAAIATVVVGHGQHEPLVNEQDMLSQEHINEHNEGHMNTSAQMSGTERMVHFFKQHDYNTDNLLDGLELFQAYLHNVHDYIKQNPESKKNFDAQQITDSIAGVVDNMLKFDGNKDGYLTFAEMRIYYMHNNLL